MIVFLEKEIIVCWARNLIYLVFVNQLAILGVIWHDKGWRLRRLLQDWVSHPLSKNHKHLLHLLPSGKQMRQTKKGL